MKAQDLFVFTLGALLPLYLVILVMQDPDFFFTGFRSESNMRLDPSIKRMVERRMKVRKELLLQMCSRLGLDKLGNDSDHTPSSWEFLVNEKYRLIWCNIFKAGSTTWFHNFNILAGYTPEFLKNTTEVPLILARKKYPRVSLEELYKAQNNAITFIIVRHPFIRLLSAYIDKLVFAWPGSHHDKLNKQIIKRFRRSEPDTPAPKRATFKEFVTWFLTYIRRSKYIEMHLVKQTKFCTPCLINFDMILKTETFEEDQMYLIEEAGLSNAISLEWHNAGKANKTTELLEEYYSQLTFEQLTELYSYYREDFLVFGYSAEPFYKLFRYRKRP